MRRESEFLLMPHASRLMPYLTGRHFLGFLHGLLDGADHIECLLRDLVVFAVNDFFEAANGVFQFYIVAGRSGKGFGDVKRLRQETLNFSCPGDRQFIVFRELVHTENGDDILQVFIALQNQLDRTRLRHNAPHPPHGDPIFATWSRADPLPDKFPIPQSGATKPWSHQDGRNVVAGAGSVKSSAGNVNRLDRSDRTLVGRGDAFLQFAQVGRQSWLITDG